MLLYGLTLYVISRTIVELDWLLIFVVALLVRLSWVALREIRQARRRARSATRPRMTEPA